MPRVWPRGLRVEGGRGGRVWSRRGVGVGSTCDRGRHVILLCVRHCCQFLALARSVMLVQSFMYTAVVNAFDVNKKNKKIMISSFHNN